MQFSRLLLRAIVPCLLIEVVLPQELPFEIPVELVGFPIIILAVRLSNFLKKLSYAVSPNTYRSRARRGSEHAALDITEIEKKLIHEMGDKVCVYEDVCVEYADKVNKEKNYVLDWQDIFRHYEKFPSGKKEFYLLSVFMGDIVKSKEICSQLAKRGRSCDESSSHLPGDHFQSSITNSHKSRMNHANQTKEVQGDSKDDGYHHTLKPSEIHHHHVTSHHHSLNQQEHRVKPRQIHQSEFHQQVHRHHVEVHYDPNRDLQNLLYGQHPAHYIHYSSRRVNNS